MADPQRISCDMIDDDVAVVQFKDRKILDEGVIQDLGRELFGLVEEAKHKKILLDSTNVEFLSSAALGKLISMHKKVDQAEGKLEMCSIRPEIYDVFKITRLNEKFDIYDDRDTALGAFRA